MPIQSKQQPPYYEQGIAVKTYKALVSQAGTAAPTVTILQNTLGDIVWTRFGAGIYIGTLNGAFPTEKTAMHIQQDEWGAKGQRTINSNFNTNSIYITTTDTTWTAVDNRLNFTSITINVYQ